MFNFRAVIPAISLLTVTSAGAEPAPLQPITLPCDQEAGSPGKVVIDVLLAINLAHLGSIYKTAEQLQAETMDEINRMLQNSALADKVEFRVADVYLFVSGGESMHNTRTLHRRRDEVNADLVLELSYIDGFGVAGEAHTGGIVDEFMGNTLRHPDEDCFYTVVDVRKSDSTINKTAHVAPHELAHLLGCGHSDSQSTQPWQGMYDFSTGALDSEADAATLMTYEQRSEHGDFSGSFKSLLVLSSPGTYTENGTTYRIGSAMEDNRRTFLMSAPMVAGYRAGSPSAVLNDAPAHAFELPQLRPFSYYVARLSKNCEQEEIFFPGNVALFCTQHVPYLVQDDEFCRVWGTTAAATADSQAGGADVWYKLRVEKTAEFTAGFRTLGKDVRDATPTHPMRVRVYKRNGQELQPLPCNPATAQNKVHGACCFQAQAGDELYFAVEAVEQPGIFNFFLRSRQSTPPALAEYYHLSPTEAAALQPNAAMLQQTLQQTDSVPQQQLDTALKLSAVMGYTEHCRMLMAAGANPSAARKNELTALFLAIAGGHAETARLLRGAGACLHTDEQQLQYAWHLVLQTFCFSAVQNLITDGTAADTATEVGSTALMHAAGAGYASTLQFLLAAGADPNARTHDGLTPLIYATGNGHAECVRLLLENGANANQANDTGLTPLFLAALRGYHECVEALLQAGASTDVVVDGNFTPLFIAIRNEHTRCVQLLLEHGTAHSSTKNAYSAIIFAATNRSTDILRSLLQNGENPNYTTDKGVTPLIVAAEQGRADNIRLLLEHGANINHTDADGDSALLVAIMKGRTDCVQILLEAGADPTIHNANHVTPLQGAAVNGHAECLKLLLELGCRDSATKNDGITALMLAAANGSTECVRLLLQHGADADARNKENMTALSYSVRRGHTECARILLENGANVNICHSETQNTPLLDAAILGHTDCLRLLLQHGANAKQADAKANSALVHAVRENHPQCVALLLEYGALANSTDPRGLTPLHHAALNGYKECLLLLLQAGANANPPVPENCYSPLEAAVSRNSIDCARILLEAGARVSADGTPDSFSLMVCESPDIMRLLLQHGANPNSVHGDDKFSALMFALSYQKPDCAELLLEAGADISYRNNNGISVILHAAGVASPATFNLLLQKGANLADVDNEGNNVLMRAAANENTRLIAHLLQLGVDVNATNHQGKNAYLFALENGDSASADLLEKLGADTSKTDNRGYSPLHYAASSPTLIAKLLQRGANVNATAHDGTTPLMLAVHSDDTEAASLLLQAGADVHLRDNNGRTAFLHAVAHCDNRDILELLLKHGANAFVKDNSGANALRISREENNGNFIDFLRSLGPDGKPRKRSRLRKLFD
ncbi:MAG: ankyrin repeat domain-containing protein [Akkermansia sp.]|nr:ankyrin repeat domain-containing protein [Akkermansia sp.]